MPADEGRKWAIESQEEYCKGLLTAAKDTLDGTAPDEKELRNHLGNLSYTKDALKKLYRDLQDDNLKREDVTKEQLSACYQREREMIVPVEEMMRRLDERLNPKESSSRSWFPHLKLETFTGEMGKFQAFIDSFEASIDLRTDIPEVDKLNILKSYLKGDPYTLVNTFQVTAKNYKSAKEILKNRYGNQCRYELNLAKEFADLKSPSHNLKELNRFHSVYEATLRSMENVGCDLKACEWLVIRMLKSKLREDTWTSLNSICNVESCTLQEFRKGYSQLLAMMEAMPKDEKAQHKFIARKEDQDKFSENPNATSQKQKGYWHRDKEDIGNYHISSREDKQRSASKKTTKGASSNPTFRQESQCLLCNGDHHFFSCSTYPTVEERQRRTAQLHRCLLCFRGHHASDCNTKLQMCGRCKQGKHHALFCQGASTAPTEDDAQVDPVVLSVDAGREVRNGAIPTVQAFVGGPNGSVSTRVFLDLGAQKTFVSADFIKQQKITPTGSVDLAITGFTGPWPKRDFETVTLEVTVGDKSEKIDAVVVEKLPERIHTKGLKGTVRYLRKKGIKLADPSLDEDVVPNLGILMGTDYALNFLKGVTTIDGIKLFETSGGYAPVGPLPSEFIQSGTTVTSVTVANVYIQIDPDLSKPTLSEEFVPQQWEVGLLNKEEITERIKEAQVTPSTHYLPHVSVIKNSETTPVEMVSDSSAKQDNKPNSLKDSLYSGPSLNGKIGKVLTKFRTGPVATAVDVSKALVRAGLGKEDRDFTSLSWPENPNDTQSSSITFRSWYVLFGATSTPFLLQTMAEANIPLQYGGNNASELGEAVNLEPDGDQKSLGFNWNSIGDALNMMVLEFECGPLTKRKFLSSLSRVSDPLGLLSPLAIAAWVFKQETCKLQFAWVSLLPVTIPEQRKANAKRLKGLSQISFPEETCCESEAYDLVFCYALHRATYVNEVVQTLQLVMSKAKTLRTTVELTKIYVRIKPQQCVRDTLTNVQFENLHLWSRNKVVREEWPVRFLNRTWSLINSWELTLSTIVDFSPPPGC